MSDIGDDIKNNESQTQNIPHEEVKHMAVKCPGCGATNTVYSNKENECEYCGTKLSFG